MHTIASPDDRRRLIQESVEPWVPRPLHAVLDDLAVRYGDRDLVATPDRTYTYREAVEESLRIAGGLAARGIGPGDRVAIVMANYAEYVPLKFAISRLGAVAVPLNYLYREQELAYVLGQSRTNCLVTMSSFMDQHYSDMLDVIAPGWEDGDAPALPDLRSVVIFENDGQQTTRDVTTFGDLCADRGDDPTVVSSVNVSADDLSDIVYTSGTTGSPKGVMVRHDTYLRSSYATALTRAFEDGRRLLFAAPLFHMFSYVEALLASMWVGGTVIPQRTFSAPAFLEAVGTHRASEIVVVPTMTVALVEEAERTHYDLDSLLCVFSAAAPAPLWLWEKCRSVLKADEVITGYGMTESGAGVTMTRPEDSLEVVSRTVGRIKMAGTSGTADDPSALAVVRTVDPTTGAPLPDGTEGELALKAPTLMSGFWEKPDETVAVFDGEWLRTGDVGIVRPEGVSLTGRTKELYKSGGELVMPKEVEDVIARLDGVSQAYAIGLPDDRWGEIGCAVVVLSPGSTVDAEAVIAHCREHLARFKVPKRVAFRTVDSLPTTPSGKVRKVELVAQLRI
ncbi:MAG: fatty-acyl-CoA synthase [Nocardioidaceae bacterium]|nr:fatty-acyl-CoA synthase [Nocardioidaceae bacterium]